MLILALTTDKISVITSSGADIDAHASWVDDLADAMTPGKTNTAILTATTTDIVPVPGASTYRNIKFLSLRNIDGATSNDVTVQFNANGTLYTLFKCTLLAGEELVCHEGVWFHYDSNGGVYGQALPVASDTVVGGIEIATQAEQEAGSSITLAVTPGRQHFHPSAAKFWVIFTGNSTTITASYNMTSITDGATQATVTIATDFSSTAWCVLATAVAAAVSAAGARLASCLTMAAGSIIVFCMDAQATPALADPTSWCVAGWGDQ